MAKAPVYELARLCKDCGCGRVHVLGGALKTAATDFSLLTAPDVLRFIEDGGLEDVTFRNCEPWHNNPDPNVVICVHAYVFRSGARRGYIAFFYQPKTGKWVIKSFKQDDPSGYGKANIFAHAFGNRGKLK